MKTYTVHIQTTYNYWFNLSILALNEFSARRIGKRWSKGKYFSDCICRITVTEDMEDVN